MYVFCAPDPPYPYSTLFWGIPVPPPKWGGMDRCLVQSEHYLKLFSRELIFEVFQISNLQGGPKKVSQIIFAITLSTASQFPQFLAHIHYRKFATRRYTVSTPNTVCVTALPCKILITTLPICLYMFTTINNNNNNKKFV